MANLFEAGHSFALLLISDKVVIDFNIVPLFLKIFLRNHLYEVAFIDADLSWKLVVDPALRLSVVQLGCNIYCF